MRRSEGPHSVAWEQRLPRVFAALNNQTTRLTGKKPAGAIKEKTVAAEPLTPYFRSVRGERKDTALRRERLLFFSTRRVGRWRAKSDRPDLVFRSLHTVFYYLLDGPGRSFMREELIVVPSNTLPLLSILFPLPVPPRCPRHRSPQRMFPSSKASGI